MLQPQLVQLRSPRVPLRADVALDDGQRLIHGQSLNLSRTGILVFPGQTLSLSRFLNVAFWLPGDPDFYVQAPAFQVRQAGEHTRRAWGLRFLTLPAAAQAPLAAFLESALSAGAAR